MRDIEFVSYDGEWPNLCRGTLTLLVDGVEHKFAHCLVSGGETGFSGDDYTEPYVVQAPWKVDFGWGNDNGLHFTENEIKFITLIVNENVEEGCCGGCI